MTAIDWAGAEVHDGTLTVPLSGNAPKAWRERVVAVADRLGHKDVEVKKRSLVVGDVHRGGEDELHHLLESAVLQANADLGEDDDGEEGRDEPDDEASEADREMTAAFRAFA